MVTQVVQVTQEVKEFRDITGRKGIPAVLVILDRSVILEVLATQAAQDTLEVLDTLDQSVILEVRDTPEVRDTLEVKETRVDYVITLIIQQPQVLALMVAYDLMQLLLAL